MTILDKLSALAAKATDGMSNSYWTDCEFDLEIGDKVSLPALVQQLVAVVRAADAMREWMKANKVGPFSAGVYDDARAKLEKLCPSP